MASGDVRQSRGRGGGGGASYSYYDDEGRGDSKNVWEWFQRYYEGHGYTDESLLAIDADNCYQLVKASTSRFGVEDITRYATHDEDYATKRDDSRARRLVNDKSDGEDEMWITFHKHLVDGYEQHRKELEAERKLRNASYEEYNRLARIAREAEVARLKEELTAQVNNIIDVSAGAIRSDFVSAFDMTENHYQLSGDELDDVVEGYATGRGYSEEVRRPGGIKLQITVSIDLSNSMYYNRIHTQAAAAFMEIGVALKQMKIEHPDDLYIAFFSFSDGADGKYAGVFTRNGDADKVNSYYVNADSFENTAIVSSTSASMYELTRFNSKLNSYNVFQGEDTWIAPLFEQIEMWENKYSDPGAARLDIVITDAVLEHVSDIRDANKIQERRNGNLQTVLLNLMPEAQWSTGTMPKRCTQYGANVDNISGMLRQVIGEFVAAYV